MIEEIIRQRQSCRSYKPEMVEKEKIMKCLEAARLAPSACNAQAWKFIVVDQAELKNEVAKATSGVGINKFPSQAPIIIAAVLEKPNSTSALGAKIKRKDYIWMDIGIAIEHICLQATELGLGTCIIGWFDEKEIKELLSIPKSRRVPLLIAMGYPNDEQRAKSRKPIEEICSFNKY